MPIDGTQWLPHEPGPGGSVVGTVLRSVPIELAGVGRSTRLWAWVPDRIGEGTPVLYMHDGDNLFDEAASNAGEWQVDEAMTARGGGAVVVGIPNGGDRRMHEYCPWPNHFTADVVGDEYIADLVDVIVPFVESTLVAPVDRSRRGVMGSSLGGVISLYAFLERPHVFGVVGSMSTAAWWTPAIWPYLAEAVIPDGRVYLDVGTNEMPDDPETSRAYVDSFHRLRRWACAGLSPGRVLAIEERGAIHHETAWARRLPTALDFLLSG